MRLLRRRGWVPFALAVVLTILVVEQAVAHDCPMHTSVQANSGVSAHAEHGAPEQPSHDQHSNCDCLGICSAAAATPTPVALVSIVPVPEIEIRNVPKHEYVEPSLEPRHDYELPFANGPPRLS